MDGSFQFGGINAGVSPEGATQPVDDAAPFRILLMGDFSGRANRRVRETGATLAKRRMRTLDRDNFDDIVEQLQPALERTIVSPEGEAVSVAFNELDDFHPDRLYDRLQLFAELRRLRRRLQNPDTFADAADEVRSWAGAPQKEQPRPPEKNPPASPPPAASGDEPGGLLEAALAQTEETDRVESDPWSDMIADIVAPYATPAADPSQGDLVDCVDKAIGESMSALLSHPDFQSLESNWRGAYELIRRLETDSSLQVNLLDISKEEIAADLANGENLSETGLYKLLVEQTVGTPGAAPYAVLIGLFNFQADSDDVLLLGNMGLLAKVCSAPFVFAAAADVVGVSSPSLQCELSDLREQPSPVWQSLRGSGVASYLGAVWPRFLQRLPYGKKTSPVDDFAYEEMPGEPQHRRYLWGNGGFVLACLLGEAFTRSGWDLSPQQQRDFGGLPVHVYDDQGEPTARPCGETLLTERTLERVATLGVMPLVSIKNEDRVRLAGVFGINNQPLAGRWRG